MKLLIHSIEADGYTQPIVANPEEETIRIIDGYHRRQAEKASQHIHQSTAGYLPVTIIRKEQSSLGDRMASTIRHNRARGSHDVELMSSIVKDLVEMGKSDDWIARSIGMDKDEILRLKQITGLASLFATKEFSQAWE